MVSFVSLPSSGVFFSLKKVLICKQVCYVRLSLNFTGIFKLVG